MFVFIVTNACLLFYLFITIYEQQLNFPPAVGMSLLGNKMCKEFHTKIIESSLEMQE